MAITLDILKPLFRDDFQYKETIAVLKADFWMFASWGCSKMGIEGKSETNPDFVKMLLLKVNGHHHKGIVAITLEFNDTYTVHIINNRGRVLNTYTDVYFDQLFEVIDNRIEKIADYHH
ncbi:MAG: hypothetical protein WCK10_03465 [Candidatus Staskawiczbacteria bacterium]